MKILEVIKHDVKSLIKMPIVVLLLCGIAILPSFYAWFNLKSSWDPYSNTQGIKIAIINEDTGSTIQGKDVNIGNELMNELKKNDKFGWVKYKDLKDAEHDLRLGKLYALIHLPKEFSSDTTSILEKEPKRAIVDYQVNQKINSIAPKMTNAGASGITASMNEKFVEAVSKVLLEQSNDLGLDLQNKLPMYYKLENAVFEAESYIPELERFKETIIKMDNSRGDVNRYADEFYGLGGREGEVLAGANKLIEANQHAGDIRHVGQVITDINNRMPEIEAALERANVVESKFPKINAEVARGLSALETTRSILIGAQSKLADVKIPDKTIELPSTEKPKLPSTEVPKTDRPVTEAPTTEAPTTEAPTTEVTTEAPATEAPTTEVTTEVPSTAVTQTVAKEKGNNADLTPAVNALDEGVTAISDLITNQSMIQSDALDKLKNNNVSPEALKSFNDNIQQSINFNNQMLEVMKDAKKLGIDTSGAIEALNDVNAKLNAVSKDLSNGKVNLDNINAAQSALSSLAQYSSNDLKSILAKQLSVIDGNLGNIASKVGDIETFTNNINALLTNAIQVTDNAYNELSALNNALPNIESRYKEINDLAQSNFPAFKQKIGQANNFVQQDLPSALNDLNRVSNFAANDLPGVLNKYHEAVDLLQNNLPGAEEKIHALAKFAQDDLPSIEKDITSAANKFRDLDKNDTLNKIIKLLKNDLTDESDYLAEPIHLNEKDLFPIPNYGSANAPFYTALALWVGALLLANLVATDLIEEDLRKVYSLREVYLGRLVLFLSIGLIQAFIVVMGNFFILGAYAKHPVLNVLFAMLVSMTFMIIVYTMVSLFGNIGKALAIVMLVLQLSAGGGTFPVQVTPEFFQAIHPFLPFTYAVDLLREAVGGTVKELVTKNILMLVVFSAITLIVGYIFKPKMEPSRVRMRKVSEESHLLE